MQQACSGQIWYYNYVFISTTTSAYTNNGSYVLTFMRLCSPQISHRQMFTNTAVYTVHMYTNLFLSSPCYKERRSHASMCIINTTSKLVLYHHIHIYLHSNSLPNTTCTHKEWVSTQHPENTHTRMCTHTHTQSCVCTQTFPPPHIWIHTNTNITDTDTAHDLMPHKQT